MPNACANRLQSSSEFAGRRAGSGYSAVVIGVTRGERPVNGACAATMRLATPRHAGPPDPAGRYGAQAPAEAAAPPPPAPATRRGANDGPARGGRRAGGGPPL